MGCMHMTCTSPCKFQFCWLCLGSWLEHRAACNSYVTTEKQKECEKIREMAKRHIVRYTHYYERWAANEKSRQKAVADLLSMRSEKLERLSAKQAQPVTQLKFVLDAWEQIAECRRVLKMTYAYGYYLPEHEHAKRKLFEYLQGAAEHGLERLHKTAEEEIQVFFDAQNPSIGFTGFRIKLIDLTSVTRNYFENLVHALETGLQDVALKTGLQDVALQTRLQDVYPDSYNQQGTWSIT